MVDEGNLFRQDSKISAFSSLFNVAMSTLIQQICFNNKHQRVLFDY